jgi:hypothetical protein
MAKKRTLLMSLRASLPCHGLVGASLVAMTALLVIFETARAPMRGSTYSRQIPSHFDRVVGANSAWFVNRA